MVPHKCYEYYCNNNIHDDYVNKMRHAHGCMNTRGCTGVMLLTSTIFTLSCWTAIPCFTPSFQRNRTQDEILSFLFDPFKQSRFITVHFTSNKRINNNHQSSYKISHIHASVVSHRILNCYEYYQHTYVRPLKIIFFYSVHDSYPAFKFDNTHHSL